MKKYQVFLLLAAFFALQAPAHGVELVELAEVTPGQTGFCVTEMGGGERVEIPLTVLGTIGAGGPESEIVLVRLDDPRFEKTGIIAGMSGSPVYLDGRLLGALAYGWSFSKDPIGGVTPFARMVKIDASQTLPQGVSGRPDMATLLAAAADNRLGSTVMEWLVPSGSGHLRPLPLAVAAGGMALPAESGWLAESWRRLGWITTPGGAGPGATADSEVSPGSMIASVLVDGDATLAAGGTVTEVRGDRLWAFGHPSFGAGTTLMPMMRAHVVAVLPSLMSSFKFFTTGEPIGAVTVDLKDGLVGRLGHEAPMVPVRVGVGDESFEYRVVRHPVLLPLLAAYLTQASQSVRGRTFGEQTVRGRVDLRYPGLDPVLIESTFAGTQAGAEAAGFVAMVVAYLENSTFERPVLESINIHIEHIEEIQAATILDIVPDRRTVRPGDDLQVRFRIQPYRGPESVETLSVAIPDGLADGRIDLVAADGAAWTAYDLQMRPFSPRNFADEIRLVNSLRPSTFLVAVLERQDLGIAVAGGSLSAPPGIVLQLRSALGPNLETVSHGVFSSASLELPMAVSGAQRIPLTVRGASQ